MNKINPEKIGRVLSVGGEHLIRQYGQFYVIKTPVGIRHTLQRQTNIAWVARDYATVRRYFGKFALLSEIIFSADSYAIIQKKVSPRPLTIDALKTNPKIKEDFLRICRNNKKLIERENVSWDFYGAMGLLRPRARLLSNLVIESDQLQMIDFGIMHLEKQSQHWLIYLITKWAYNRQNRFLKKVLKEII